VVSKLEAKRKAVADLVKEKAAAVSDWTLHRTWDLTLGSAWLVLGTWPRVTKVDRTQEESHDLTPCEHCSRVRSCCRYTCREKRERPDALTRQVTVDPTLSISKMSFRNLSVADLTQASSKSGHTRGESSQYLTHEREFTWPLKIDMWCLKASHVVTIHGPDAGQRPVTWVRSAWGQSNGSLSLGIYKYVLAGPRLTLLAFWHTWHPCEPKQTPPTHLHPGFIIKVR
jgi:hypothetical protein